MIHKKRLAFVRMGDEDEPRAGAHHLFAATLFFIAVAVVYGRGLGHLEESYFFLNTEFFNCPHDIG